MPGEMCDEPTKIFTSCHYKLNRQSSQEKIGIKKKLIVYYFFVLTIGSVDPLKVGPELMFPTPSFKIEPCWDLQDIF